MVKTTRSYCKDTLEVNVTYFKFKHFKSLIDIAETRNLLEVIEYRNLPKIGYIAYQGKMPIAVGFLRRIEPYYAQIDTLISNAYCGSILRNEAIEKILESLILDAKLLKIKAITAHIRDKETLLRAETHGFLVVSHAVLALSLQEKRI